jgi:hypothetical protein
MAPEAGSHQLTDAVSRLLVAPAAQAMTVRFSTGTLVAPVAFTPYIVYASGTGVLQAYGGDVADAARDGSGKAKDRYAQRRGEYPDKFDERRLRRRWLQICRGVGRWVGN